MLSPMDTTEHDLKLLSIGYFVQGGVVTFAVLLILCYAGVMGIVLFSAIQKSAQSGSGDQLPGWFLPVIGAVVVAALLMTLAMGFLLIYAGVALRRHKHRTFLMVMAALSCMSIPYGALLGIFTFIVLQRPSAKVLFGRAPAFPPPLPQAR
jgi:uncharacterized membrane protein YjgN (DUF898 family)